MVENIIQKKIKELQKEIHTLQEVTTSFDAPADKLNKALTQAYNDFEDLEA